MVNAAELRFLRKIERKIRIDKFPNSNFRYLLKSMPILEVVREAQLGWLRHLYRMKEDMDPRSVFKVTAHWGRT